MSAKKQAAKRGKRMRGFTAWCVVDKNGLRWDSCNSKAEARDMLRWWKFHHPVEAKSWRVAKVRVEEVE